MVSILNWDEFPLEKKGLITELNFKCDENVFNYFSNIYPENYEKYENPSQDIATQLFSNSLKFKNEKHVIISGNKIPRSILSCANMIVFDNVNKYRKYINRFALDIKEEQLEKNLYIVLSIDNHDEKINCINIK